MENPHKKDAEKWQNCYDLLFGNKEKNIEAILPESENELREILNSLFNYWHCHSERMTMDEFRVLKKKMPKNAPSCLSLHFFHGFGNFIYFILP